MNNFDITFKWIGAATWVLTIDELKIACDPSLCARDTEIDLKYFKAIRRTNPNYSPSDFENVDYWFLTHNHADHIDNQGISKISKQSNIFSHKSLKSRLNRLHDMNIYYLKWNNKKYISNKSLNIEIEAIPCIHGSNTISSILSGGCNGYWIKLIKADNTLDIYITGDTIFHQRVSKVINNRKVDIIIPNMGGSGLGKFGGPFTLTAEIFKQFLDLVNPKVILPVHHTSFSMFKESIKVLYKLNDKRIIKFSEGETINI